MAASASLVVLQTAGAIFNDSVEYVQRYSDNSLSNIGLELKSND